LPTTIRSNHARPLQALQRRRRSVRAWISTCGP